jgi:DNA polymerase elongation subunit (family B)
MEPRILIYDIEVTSDIGDSWQKWDTNIHHYRRNWYMLCFAYKWYGDKKTKVVAQPDFVLQYDKEPHNDYWVVEKLHSLFNEADVIIAHNGDSFDQKKAQARMIMHGFDPPSLYKQIDTKKVARKYFNFTSNKLDDLAGYLGVPGKMDTGGYGLWIGCEQGDMRAWRKMKKYNKQDVVVLERVYEKFLPWIQNHPAMNLGGDLEACPKCGKGPMQKRGKYSTKTNLIQMVWCLNCHGYSKQRINPTAERPMYIN